MTLATGMMSWSNRALTIHDTGLAGTFSSQTIPFGSPMTRTTSAIVRARAAQHGGMIRQTRRFRYPMTPSTICPPRFLGQHERVASQHDEDCHSEIPVPEPAERPSKRSGKRHRLRHDFHVRVMQQHPQSGGRTYSVQVTDRRRGKGCAVLSVAGGPELSPWLLIASPMRRHASLPSEEYAQFGQAAVGLRSSLTLDFGHPGVHCPTSLRLVSLQDNGQPALTPFLHGSIYDQC